jgi:DNA-binding CsgD family transcriptional regulator
MNRVEREGFRPDELELSILRRLVAGESYEQVAAAEYISVRTVRRQVSALKRHTASRTIAALCAEATRQGWVY